MATKTHSVLRSPNKNKPRQSRSLAITAPDLVQDVAAVRHRGDHGFHNLRRRAVAVGALAPIMRGRIAAPIDSPAGWPFCHQSSWLAIRIARPRFSFTCLNRPVVAPAISAFNRTTDSSRTSRHVRKVPTGDIEGLAWRPLEALDLNAPRSWSRVSSSASVYRTSWLLAHAQIAA